MNTTENERRPASSGWWLVLLALLLWNAFALWPRGAGPQPVAYSAFLADVRAGRVASVRISGARIEGTRKRAQRGSAAFETTFPETVGDTRLLALLETHQVAIDVQPPPSPWLLQLAASWLPTILLVGFFGVMMSRGGGGAALGFGRAKPQRYTSAQPKVTFDDVAGADEAKDELREEVDFLRNPEKYRALGAEIPKGILLVGPPGTGKTLLARAIAGEAGVPFLSLNASEFVEMFVGVGASRVRDLFRQAKEAAPAIVFIDELDAVGRRRGAGIGTVNDEREQTLNQLLGELDGFDRRANVIILAATNRPDVLDPALLRPGRFDRQVAIGLPDRAGREAILRIHVKKLRAGADVDLATIAGTTIGLTGADLENLCNEAALTAARRDRGAVTMADFDDAQDRLRLGAAHHVLLDPAERRVVAYHEAGHAVVAWLTPGADPVRKVTIVQHGQALGQTQQLPQIERRNLPLRYLTAKLQVLLAGRAAEELVFDEITTGAESDLVEATKLARQMVTRWGMGTLGLAAFASDEQQPFLGYEMAQGRDYSEATAARIDRDVARLLDEAHVVMRVRLAAARERLDAVAAALLRDETIDAGALAAMLGAAPALAS